jgi:hypothetical protein
MRISKAKFPSLGEQIENRSSKPESLEIAFHGGRIYEYCDVPVGVYEELMNAQSHGKFFANFIRGAYAFRRIQ